MCNTKPQTLVLLVFELDINEITLYASFCALYFIFNIMIKGCINVAECIVYFHSSIIFHVFLKSIIESMNFRDCFQFGAIMNYEWFCFDACYVFIQLYLCTHFFKAYPYDLCSLIPNCFLGIQYFSKVGIKITCPPGAHENYYCYTSLLTPFNSCQSDRGIFCIHFLL